MKIPRFRPRQYPDRLLSWGVDIPAYLSPSKRPERRFFLRKEEAREFAAHMRRRYDDHLHDSTYLSRDKLSDAARAYDAITQLTETTGKSYSLLGIVEDFADKERQRVKSITLDKLFDQFLAARQDKSEVYLTQMRWCKSKLGRLGHRMVSTITDGDVEAALRREPPSSRNAHIRYLGVVLRWGVKKSYLSDDSAVRKLELSPIKPQEVQIYSVDEVRGCYRTA